LRNKQADASANEVSATAVPQDALQSELVDLWKRLLGVAGIGIDDDFFVLGGTLTLKDRMFAILGGIFGEPMAPADRERSLTVRSLADEIVDRLEARPSKAHCGATVSLIAPELIPPQNVLQDQLAALWERMLGRSKIGIDEDFVAMGGTPELCDRMFVEVARLSGECLGREDVQGRLTVRHVTHALISRVPRSPILEIQPGRPGVTPLFFLHGDLAGGGYYTRELARGLGPERPLFVLQQHGMHGEDLPITVEAMAADHLARLSESYPDGAFDVGGHCCGSIIALEMAHQFARCGRRVRTLVLVEPPLVAPDRQLLPPPRLSLAARRMPHVLGSWLFTTYSEVLKTYNCPVFDGKTVVFWAGESTSEEKLDRPEARSLLKRVAPNSEIHVCRGSHITLLGRHVRDLAATMKPCLAVDEAVSDDTESGCTAL
jgi:pimeloyl-ACP methyl ester carboxylesterase